MLIKKVLIAYALLLIFSLGSISCKKENEIPGKTLKLLLKVNVPQNAINNIDENYIQTGWIFISDSDGVTLGVKKYNNGDLIEFVQPDGFNDEKIFLSLLKAEQMPLGKFDRCVIQTYEISVGEEIFLPNYPSYSNYKGSSAIKVKNVPEIHEQNQYYHNQLSHDQNDAISYKTDDANGNIGFGISLYDSPVTALLSFKVDENLPYKYKIFNLEGNQEYDVDYNDLGTMDGVFEYALPHPGFIELFGSVNSGENRKLFHIGFNGNNKGNFFYPKELFSEFRIQTGCSWNNIFYGYEKFGGLNMTYEYKPIDYYNLLPDLNNFSLDTKGEFDLYSLKFLNSFDVSNHTYVFEWNMNGIQKSNITGFIPMLPEEISNEYAYLKRDQLKMKIISFTELTENNGANYYKEFFNGTFKSKGTYYIQYTLPD